MTQEKTIIIDSSRKNILKEEFEKPYFFKIKETLKKELSSGHSIYPQGKQIFNAFNLTPFDQVKVVILGQDPYHGTGEAHGLSFSVPEGIRIPPSLRNIFKELKADLDIDPPLNWNLEKRAKQGILLLNASLTVRKNSPNSHKDIGWQIFTDAVIKTLSDKKEGIVLHNKKQASLILINILFSNQHIPHLSLQIEDFSEVDPLANVMKSLNVSERNQSTGI